MGLPLSQLQGYLGSSDSRPLAPQNLAVAWFSLTAMRPGERLENQDNLVLVDAVGDALWLENQLPMRQAHTGWPAGRMRLAVLDGMGGHADGRQVAEAAARSIAMQPPYASQQQMVAELDALHTRLQTRFSARLRPPGCTLTLLELSGQGEAWLYHVGDSRLYEWRRQDAVACLTVDHVPATRAAIVDILGEPDWRQLVHGRLDSTISQAFVLGNALTSSGGELRPALAHLDRSLLPAFLEGMDDCRPISLRRGSSYLLATDGLWHVPAPAILVNDTWPSALADADTAEAALEALLMALCQASRPGLSDNTTAMLLQVGS
ncbi:MAG: hypothetical protein JJU06_08350 [Ectothiorhodospiraceae bacterium]|nr:hypothetical protein [Ectothiorhodospiraceae bacterium]MCH8506830.1 hypothetical protein [Ectothiorhodospiraceae bacterium]